MPVVMGNKNVEVNLDVDGEIVTFVFPSYANQNFKAAIRKLLKNRVVQTSQGDSKFIGYETRAKFFDDNCIDCKGAVLDDAGEMPLSPQTPIDVLQGYEVSAWYDLIPDNWKAEVSSHFEESAVKARAKIDSE